MSTENTTMLRGAMSVKDFAKWASIGRTTVWKQIHCRNLKVIRIGRRTLIPMEAAQEWLQRSYYDRAPTKREREQFPGILSVFEL